MIRWSHVHSLEDLAKVASDLEKSVKAARERLATEATSDTWEQNRTENLLSSVHAITKLEAKLAVLQTAVQYLEHETKPTGDQVWQDLVNDFALRSVDDTWSGRGNELKRIVHEAHVDILRDLKYELKSLV